MLFRSRHWARTPAQCLPLSSGAQAGTNTENAASVALLQYWLEQDATDNSEEIQRAQEELEEFKRGMNAERERPGARRNCRCAVALRPRLAPGAPVIIQFGIARPH